MNQEPEAQDTPEDFRDELIRFRADVFTFLSGIAERYSSKGISDFASAVNEFDNRLFYMATGVKNDLGAETYAHLIKEVQDRKEVVIKHFDNPDMLTDAYSFERMLPRTTNFIRASMIANQALTAEALYELKRLDDLHKTD